MSESDSSNRRSKRKRVKATRLEWPPVPLNGPREPVPANIPPPPGQSVGASPAAFPELWSPRPSRRTSRFDFDLSLDNLPPLPDLPPSDPERDSTRVSPASSSVTRASAGESDARASRAQSQEEAGGPPRDSFEGPEHMRQDVTEIDSTEEEYSPDPEEPEPLEIAVAAVWDQLEAGDSARTEPSPLMSPRPGATDRTEDSGSEFDANQARSLRGEPSSAKLDFGLLASESEPSEFGSGLAEDVQMTLSREDAQDYDSASTSPGPNPPSVSELVTLFARKTVPGPPHPSPSLACSEDDDSWVGGPAFHNVSRSGSRRTTPTPEDGAIAETASRDQAVFCRDSDALSGLSDNAAAASAMLQYRNQPEIGVQAPTSPISSAAGGLPSHDPARVPFSRDHSISRASPSLLLATTGTCGQQASEIVDAAAAGINQNQNLTAPVQTASTYSNAVRDKAQAGAVAEVESVATSKRMLRKRSSNGSVVIERPRNTSSEQSETTKRGRKKGSQKRETVNRESWLDVLEIDGGEPVNVPTGWQPRSQSWLVKDAEDTINECIHAKQILFSLDKLVVSAEDSDTKHDFSAATLTLRLEAHNTIHGFPPILALASHTIPCSFIPDVLTAKTDRNEAVTKSFVLEPSHPFASKPISILFDPKLCRKAGTIAISLRISLRTESSLFKTRHELCRGRSPIAALVPRPGAPFLPFESKTRGESQSGIAVTVDIVPFRKKTLTTDEVEREIELRLARMELDREGAWIPDARCVTKRGPETKIRMIDLGRDGKYGYDFITKLPYRTNEVVRNFRSDVPESAGHRIRLKDDAISRTTASAREKLLNRVHVRWSMLNPYPPTILDRELACWVHYAPLVHHFSLRFELARFLLTRHVKHHLLTESEVRRILHAYDAERDKVERGERKTYDELRRAAMWVRERT